MLHYSGNPTLTYYKPREIERSQLCVLYGRFAVYGRFAPTGPTRRRCGAADRRWHAADRYGSRASPAEAAHATRSDMTEARPAMMPPQATGVAAQALGSSSGRYVRRKVSSFSGTGEPSHIA